MHTVIETDEYLRAAKIAYMSEEERDAAVTLLATNPAGGDLIVGTRGFRKLRLAGRGKGKSGGYRLITYFAELGLPVVLITVFSKGDRADLTAAERNALAATEPQLLEDLKGLR